MEVICSAPAMIRGISALRRAGTTALRRGTERFRAVRGGGSRWIDRPTEANDLDLRISVVAAHSRIPFRSITSYLKLCLIR